MKNLDFLISQAKDHAIRTLQDPSRYKSELSEGVHLNTEILKEDPKNTDSYVRLGRYFEEIGDYNAAAEAYENALTLDPAEPVSFGRIDKVKNLSKELKIIDKIEKINDSYELFWLGVAARRSKKPRVAVAALEKALTLRKDYSTLNALAGAKKDLNDYDCAINCYETALDLEDNLASRNGRAAVLRAQKKLSEAERAYQITIKIFGDNYHSYNGLAGVYIDLKNLLQAEECFEKARKLGEPLDNSIKNLEKLINAYKRTNNLSGMSRIKSILSLLNSEKESVYEEKETPEIILEEFEQQ